MASAILQDQTQMVEFLIQQSADVNAKYRDGGTALHTAAFLGQYEVAELLIQKGADVNVKDEDGETPRDHLKIDWGTTEFIASLLQIQVDREKVEAGRAQIVELLCQQGDQTDFAGPVGDGICKAAGAGDIGAVKERLAKGVDINTRDGKFGMHPLSWATFYGQFETAEFLIQKGADANAKNHKGETPMDSLKFDWVTIEFVAGLL